MSWDHTPAEARTVLRDVTGQLQNLCDILESEGRRFDPAQAPELWAVFNSLSQMVGGVAVTAQTQLQRESIRQIGAPPNEEPAEDRAVYRTA